MKSKQIIIQLLGLLSTTLLVKGDDEFISSGKRDKGYCCFEGQISDCQCKYESVEEMNKELTPVLKDLVLTTYFRYYKVDLWKECPFWPDAELLCTSERCSVPSVDISKIPDEWKAENLSKVEKSSIFGESSMFHNCDYSSNEFCIFDEESGGLRYVDLPTNPERFTGYQGDSATRVWNSIYNENCFGIPNHLGDNKDTCLEKRVYYKLISGLHASISTNVCYYWLDMKTGVWGPNIDCFIWKIGKFPDRIENIYLNFAIYIRAINKISDYLNNYKYCNGNDEEDEKVSTLIKKVTDVSKDYPFTFDETKFFNSPETKDLLSDTKFQFRNVTRIMDCVACEKCRLWGKLQITGLGTALKILFSTDDVSSLSLKRSEIVAFINGFNKLSTSINMIDEFRNLWKKRDAEKANDENKDNNDNTEKKKETETSTKETQEGEEKEEKKQTLDDKLIEVGRKIYNFNNKVYDLLAYFHIVDYNDKELREKFSVGMIYFVCLISAFIVQQIVIDKAMKKQAKEFNELQKAKEIKDNKDNKKSINKNEKKKSKKIN
ncbi:endoplasmic oxidoreductin [Anaeromyces robustus]|uniref:Endoplasmic oxidoreductin n=1 Tax=Anaeromyces robustus TaxID=1754192 RepID=A0A1Y1XE42_9FUNG|nr:endoplasmic oxidoreductin [Anaeromyces robustus]|eukprot:ORX84038.1 endoplasmic oxidoreductin [Anaeromyces robustus]